MDDLADTTKRRFEIYGIKTVLDMKLVTTSDVFKGTKYEGNVQWYHDVLTLRTCKRARLSMQTQLTEVLGAPNRKPARGEIYNNSIPGDNPEVMPLDETLNMDIHACAKHHFSLALYLVKDDPNKFYVVTPEEMPCACLCLVDSKIGNTPSSKESCKTVTNG
jgi:hypothetical protein